jgi:hypothetical protein
MATNMRDERTEDKGFFWLQYLPVHILNNIAYCLRDDDSLSFGDLLPYVLPFEMNFWRC